IDATLGDDGNYYTTLAVEGVAVVPTEYDFIAADAVYTADAGPGLVEAVADGEDEKPVGIATHDSADGKVWLKLDPNVTVVIPEPSSRRNTTMKITEKQLEAARLLEAALNGDRKAGFMLAEGISTSDLPVQLTPALNKIALAGYDNEPTIWRSFASKETVQDFGLQEWYGFTGWGDSDVGPENAGTQFISGGLPRVPEYGEYSRLRFEATEKSFRLAKSGVAVEFSWELLVDRRNFGLIPSAFSEFGRRSAETEDHEATKVLLSNVHFSAQNGNLATGAANGPLSIPALEAAFQQIA